MRQVGGINISRGSSGSGRRSGGRSLRLWRSRSVSRRMPGREQRALTSRAEVTDQRMGVALDGAMMNIKTEGWKAVEVGAVFQVVVETEPDQASGEMVEGGHAGHNSYVAHLGGPEVVGE